ncbi:hypothetical protein P280DRAFT_554610 [Massarina eburnea CBS 473.64]|uniref:Uncharacterized protein n=1 Tax=Massarina eburnea CBS 473.64 TaxID=1395130 RepID=A0A6A6RK49_9PLEO|nr:hypothetical protein P280DRAFT_554610 [Massarina eburnea CBS 473.64]
MKSTILVIVFTSLAAFASAAPLAESHPPPRRLFYCFVEPEGSKQMTPGSKHYLYCDGGKSLEKHGSIYKGIRCGGDKVQCPR